MAKRPDAKSAMFKAPAGRFRLQRQDGPSAGEIDAAVALFTEGRYAEARAVAQAMTERFPAHWFGWKILGAALVQMGRSADALAPLHAAASLSPGDAEAFCNLGSVLKDLGRFDESEASCRRALQIKPDFAEAHNNLGVALKNLGRLSDATASFAQAFRIKPEFAEAHCNLGNALADLGHLSEAEASYRQALRIRPDFVEAHNNLGNVLTDLGRLSEAEVSYRRALQISPNMAAAHCNLGSILQDLGNLEDAVASYRRALEISPDFPKARSNLLFIHNYLSDQAGDALLAEARRFGDFATRHTRPYSEWGNVPDPGRRLRVGFVSGDFRRHPVGYFVEGMLTALARNSAGRLDPIAYFNHACADSTTERIKSCCQGWRSVVGLSDASLARTIRDDGIDVLIDLSGHTAHNRLLTFAWKPAPVQASWLGYFATTGIAAMDYFIADPWNAPKHIESQFVERIWRLPEISVCFTPPDVEVEVAPLPALANGHITLGCFNKLTKMSDAVVAVWARILHTLPGSRLFLDVINETTLRQSVVDRFASHGINAGRLILERAMSRAEVLAAYRRVDIALDPFPYPGGTTTVEALWMGVPVLTMEGESFLSRGGKSYLQNAGLLDWIAVNTDDYVARAISHARDLEQLADLREGLRPQVLASPVFDTSRFVHHFEAALRGMWVHWCSQRTGRP